MRRSPANTIAFQGQPGAYSDLACREVFPKLATLPCTNFEDAIEAVRGGRARVDFTGSAAQVRGSVRPLLDEEKANIGYSGARRVFDESRQRYYR